MEDVLAVRNISKTYNQTNKVLDDISINIKRGQIVFLVGANGAGKTTLVQILLGILGCDEGEIIFQNQTLKQPFPTEVKKEFGYMPDEPLYIEYLSALGNLQYYCALYKKNLPNKELERLLAAYGLDGKNRKLVKNFSRGMKQKLALCFIDIINPKLIVMDEPTIGLDLVSIEFLKSHILQFAKQGQSLFITTHDMAFCHSIADEIYILNNGKASKLQHKYKLTNEQDLNAAILTELSELG
ncbi:ABC transporter ATP-binding protein [Neobacillus sp. Marseille-QA0830]